MSVVIKWKKSCLEFPNKCGISKPPGHELTGDASQDVWKFHICLEIPNNFPATCVPLPRHSWMAQGWHQSGRRVVWNFQTNVEFPSPLGVSSRELVPFCSVGLHSSPLFTVTILPLFCHSSAIGMETRLEVFLRQAGRSPFQWHVRTCAPLCGEAPAPEPGARVVQPGLQSPSPAPGHPLSFDLPFG